MTDYIVANCETAAFNGTYEYDIWLGLNDNPPDTVWIKWDGNGHDWENIVAYIATDRSIGQPYITDLDITARYNSNDYEALPPIAPDDPSIVWLINDIDPSALTVTAAGGGDPSSPIHEGEATLSSLSYLRTKKFPIRWWLAGGIAAANCEVAYQAKGAVSYAASLVNLANAGTYNATEGVAPTWATGTGWSFDGIDDYLSTQYYKAKYDTTTMLIRYSDAPSTPGSDHQIVMGCLNEYITRGFCFIPAPIEQNRVGILRGGYAKYIGYASGLVLAIGQKAYINGSPVSGNLSYQDYWTEETLMIGGYQAQGTTNWYFTKINVQASAIYNTLLSDAQVLAVSTAMAAL